MFHLASANPPQHTRLIASFDAEWTKNYRIRNGNQPFCYSMVYVAIPKRGTRLRPEDLRFWFRAAYVAPDTPTQKLIDAADAEFGDALQRAEILAGHQLSSDLSVLRNASCKHLSNIMAAYAAWSARRTTDTPAVIDTRYDIDGLVDCTSRRLVDVCTALNLQVYQPELAGSMTHMQQEYLISGAQDIRERLAVLNLRHSLTAAIVALRRLGYYQWRKPVNVNPALRDNLSGFYDYVGSAAFMALC